MRIIFMGSSEFSVPALERLAAQYNVVAVYTKEPKPSGRGMKLRKTPLHQKADMLGLDVLTPKNFKNDAVLEEYLSIQADMVIVAAYGIILPKLVLDVPKYGALNIHGSLLPRWRGAAPIHRAIMAGDKEIGVGIMKMSEGLDEGDVYANWSMPVTSDLTTGIAHDRLALEGSRLLIDVIEKIKNDTISAVPQPKEGVIYAHKITKNECEIDWTQNSQDIIRFIHGLNPFPSAFCYIEGVRYKIHKAIIGDEEDDIKSAFSLKTGDGIIHLQEIQAEGKKRQILF